MVQDGKQKKVEVRPEDIVIATLDTPDHLRPRGQANRGWCIKPRYMAGAMKAYPNLTQVQ
jgi:hypothetical protein